MIGRPNHNNPISTKMKKSHILILIVLLGMVCWFAYTGPDPAASLRAPEVSHQPERPTREAEAPENSGVREARAKRIVAEDGLDGVQSVLARRYLRFMLPGGRLDGQSYDQSIVNNAFKQAWGVTARIDLSEEQQDRLAEFLLEKDWSKWSQMDPKRVEQWAREHLTDGQRTALLDFIEESRQGELALSRMRLEAKMQEYGAKTPAGAFNAETLEARRIAELMAAGTDNLSPAELESRKKELKELMGAAARGENDEQTKSDAKPRDNEQSYQFFNLLADRIPMTEEQQWAVYGAMRDGVDAASNPFDYQSVPPEHVEARVRASTSWMGEMLTKEQYETYLHHYLAEIEMIRFQAGR